MDLLTGLFGTHFGTWLHLNLSCPNLCHEYIKILTLKMIYQLFYIKHQLCNLHPRSAIVWKVFIFIQYYLLFTIISRFQEWLVVSTKKYFEQLRIRTTLLMTIMHSTVNVNISYNFIQNSILISIGYMSR